MTCLILQVSAPRLHQLLANCDLLQKKITWCSTVRLWLDLIILKTYDQQFTLTIKKSLHIIFNKNSPQPPCPQRKIPQKFIKLSFLIRVNVNHAIEYHCCHCRQYLDNENGRLKPSCQTDFGFVGVWLVSVDS